MTPSRKLHQNDKLWGAVAEALVAAYALMSAKGKLSSYRPFTDVDGKDLVIDLAGGFKDIYIQVKCALGIDRNRRIGGMARLHRDRMPSSPKFVYIFCLLDRRKMELTRIWVIPSADFYRRAYRTLVPKEMIQFNFDLDWEATTDGTNSKSRAPSLVQDWWRSSRRPQKGNVAP